MDSASVIATALVHDRAFVPIEETHLSRADLIVPEWFTFIGIRSYWGSVLCCGILEMEREDEQLVKERASGFYGFSRNLISYSGSASSSMVGSFGLLIVLHRGPSSEDFRNVVASQKRGSGWRKDYCVVWLVDLARREVFAHRGLPLRMFPGTAFFRKLLVDRGPDNR